MKLVQKTLIVAMMMAFGSGVVYAQGSNVTIQGSIKQDQDSKASGDKDTDSKDEKAKKMATQVMDIGSVKSKGSTSKVVILGDIKQDQKNAGDKSTQVMEIGTAGAAELANDKKKKKEIDTKGNSDVTILGSITQTQEGGEKGENITQVMGIGNAKDGDTKVHILGSITQKQKGDNATQVMNIGNAESKESTQNADD